MRKLNKQLRDNNVSKIACTIHSVYFMWTHRYSFKQKSSILQCIHSPLSSRRHNTANPYTIWSFFFHLGEAIIISYFVLISKNRFTMHGLGLQNRWTPHDCTLQTAASTITTYKYTATSITTHKNNIINLPSFSDIFPATYVFYIPNLCQIVQ